ncbi:MAG: glycosyltransferase [Pirellulales bacterium]
MPQNGSTTAQGHDRPQRNSSTSRDSAERLVSIIVPLYNEEQNVEPLCLKLLELAASLPERVEIILVDDGSRDGTPRALEHWPASIRESKSCDFGADFGQTAAMMAGIDAAEGDIIIPMDGDLQNDPADIPAASLQSSTKATTASRAGARIARTNSCTARCRAALRTSSFPRSAACRCTTSAAP